MGIIRIFMNMLKNTLNRAKGIVNFLRENTRYIVVLFFFLVASFYSLVIARDEDKKEKKTEKTETEQVVRMQDLDHIAKSKVYPGLLSSRAGDTYRVIIRAEASAMAAIRVSARSLDGKLLPITSFDISKGERISREAVFSADGEYRDIVVDLEEKRDESGRQWDDTRVFIDRVSVTRLAASSLAEARQLNPTIFGEPERIVAYLPAHQDAMEDDSFGKSKNRIGQYFKPTDTIFTALRFRGDVVGNGGAGSYVAELGECADDICSFNEIKMLEKISFGAEDIARYKSIGSDDMYEIPLSATLDPNKLYYTGINATKAKADNANHLLLRKFIGEDATKNSFFGAVFTQKSDILSSATIEDIGNTYRYEYRMKNAESDISDVYGSSGKVKFDKSLAGLAMPQDEGASMTFRVNTIYPIIAMRMSAKGIDTKNAQFVMEYSLDEEEWREVPYVQQEDAPQVFDAAIPASGKSMVYIRARSVQDGSKFKDWGIKDLVISAALRKE